ncbi:hypothetical protein [Pelomonas cellulosilytica]|uniref:Transposase n=1 Tax=Pelomonas cellulosilytica TaxID=2906762 RepID=A0ABS8Y4I0_9BURK|nr:hypothetical protein [Pelomonas sp. P8]MCE4558237.1 hypothetical protein [Pelomonas sp. P8]
MKTIEEATQSSIDLSECIELLDNVIDPMDASSLVLAAPVLKQLANNRQFLIQRFNSDVKNYIDSDYGGNFYSPHSFLLSPASKSFFIRANIWVPTGSNSGATAKYEERLLAYNRPHDHNFSFATIGYFGPGYETLLYEHDFEKTLGHIKERVSLKYTGRATLTQGRIMIYEARKDVHTQLPPSDLSVSLNVVINRDDETQLDQFYFDVDSCEITEYSDTVPSKRVSLLRIARELGNNDTAELLLQIAKQHPCRRTQLQALLSATAVDQSTMSDARRIASHSNNALVRSFLDTPYEVYNAAVDLDHLFKNA